MSTIQAYTTATRPTASASNVGLTIFNTTDKSINISDGANWRGYAFDSAYGWTGSSEYSLDFDGTDDYVEVQHSSSLNISGALTISAWVYFDDLSGFPMIVNKRASTGHAYQFYSTSNKLAFTNGTAATSTTSLSTNTWYHVAVVANSGTATFYLNGSSDGSGSIASTMPTNTENVWLGGMSWASNYLNGRLDEVAIFNTALNSTQIASMISSNEPADLSSLSPVSWWRMGDNNGAGTATTLVDQGSGNNNATIENGASGNTSPNYILGTPSHS